MGRVARAAFFTIFIFYLTLVLYANRAPLTRPFDRAYWQNKYEQSQWKLPLSQRTIGDDGLYLWEGYRLVQGDDPTSINAEVPPFGKYLIGASTVLFHNGHLYGLIVTTLLVGALYLLAKRVLPSYIAAGIAVAFAADPLITRQYTLTMMDSLQALCAVVYILILTAGSKNNTRQTAAFSGIALGLFAATKAPILAPFLAIIGAWYIYTQTKTYTTILWFFAYTATGYILPYAVYFFQGHTLLEWARVQKWVAAFYLSGNLTPTWGSAVSTLLTGTYQNIFSRLWLKAPEWSPVWSILSVAAFTGIWILPKEKTSREANTVRSILAAMIGVYAFVPFWTRYLVVVLPFLYLTGAMVILKFSKRLSLVFVAALLLLNLTSSYAILFPTPKDTITQFLHDARHMFYRDVYEYFDTESRRTISGDEFATLARKTMMDGQIEEIDLTVLGNMPDRHNSPQTVSVRATYTTRNLGSFSRTINIPFYLEDNVWRIRWDWNYLIPGFTRDSRLQTTILPARRGSILASDKKPLAEDAPGALIWVSPGDTDSVREEQMLKTIQLALGDHIPAVAIHQRIVGNTISHIPIPIGVVALDTKEDYITRLQSYPGLTLTDAFARVTYPNHVVDIGTVGNQAFSECCSLLYNTTTYDGISGVELEKNSVLKGENGGKLLLIDARGRVIDTFITKEKRDGKNTQP